MGFHNLDGKGLGFRVWVLRFHNLHGKGSGTTLNPISKP